MQDHRTARRVKTGHDGTLKGDKLSRCDICAHERSGGQAAGKQRAIFLSENRVAKQAGAP